MWRIIWRLHKCMILNIVNMPYLSERCSTVYCTPQPLICKKFDIISIPIEFCYRQYDFCHTKKMNFKNHIKFHNESVIFSVKIDNFSCLDFQLICDLFDATLSVFFFSFDASLNSAQKLFKLLDTQNANRNRKCR